MYETYEVSWRQATAKGAIVIKRKAFKTEKARASFLARLVEKDNFIEILAYSDPY